MLEEETEAHIKHLRCIPKYNGYQGKASELQAELATFLWNTISTWKNNQYSNCNYLIFSI